ncbi:hypothetical protein [Haloplanus halophilus]|uniref:hypothetical protein n=1 Tax=Haloplanus halophilus TaxID=2949993 RepID=UPI002040F7B9|nr:hypothetical protein [Haloplanus sp. GDY1]
MDDRDDAARTVRQFHEETPHAVSVSVTLSTHTREVLSAVRDDLNDRAGEPILDTNDVVRLALEGAARYHDRAPDDGSDVHALTAAVRDAVDDG